MSPYAGKLLVDSLSPDKHMFEHRTRPLLSKTRFLRRLLFTSVVGLSALILSLGMGMAGYHFFEGLSWIDSYANASMILSGMGPLTPLQTDGGKIFAGSYALFSGLTFITVVGLILSPIVHRVFHRFHLEGNNDHEHRSHLISSIERPGRHPEELR